MAKITIIKWKNSIHIFPFIMNRYDKDLGREVGTCPQLINTFKEYDFRSKRFKLKLDIYDKKDKTLRVPIYVGIYKVIRLLQANGVDYEYLDKSNEYPEGVIFHNNKKQGIEFKNEFQSEAFEFIIENDQSFLQLDTGIGKTFVSIMSILHRKVKTLIICPNINLMNQWIDEILMFTDIDVNEVKILAGFNQFEKLRTKPSPIKIFLTTPSTLTSCFKRDPEIVKDVFYNLGIGYKIYDEAHLNFNAILRTEGRINTNFTLFLSATPKRSSFNQDKLYQMVFKEIESYGDITNGISKHYNLHYISYDTRASMFDIAKCVTNYGFSAPLYFRYLFNTEWKMDYIYQFIKIIFSSLYKSDQTAKIVVIFPTKEEITKMIKYINQKNEFDYSTGDFTTNIDSKYKRAELYNQIIFSTLGSLGEGANLYGLRAVLSFTPFKSKVKAQQLLGRLRKRDEREVHLYDFIDVSFPELINLQESRKSVFNFRSKTIKEKFISYEKLLEISNENK